MKKVSKNNKQEKDGGKALVALGVLAGLAGAYFFYGSKDAHKNRKKIKAWSLKAKAEIVEKLEKINNASEEQYNTIVDAVLKKYSALKSIDTSEVDALGHDLKRHWKAFQKELLKVKKS